MIVALVHDDLRGEVLRGAAQCECLAALLDLFDKAKIGDLRLQRGITQPESLCTILHYELPNRPTANGVMLYVGRSTGGHC